MRADDAFKLVNWFKSVIVYREGSKVNILMLVDTSGGIMILGMSYKKVAEATKAKTERVRVECSIFVFKESYNYKIFTKIFSKF